MTFYSLCVGHGGLSLIGGEQEKVDSMLVMSGGEGYIDFRLGKSSQLLVMYGDQGNVDLLNVLIHASYVQGKSSIPDP